MKKNLDDWEVPLVTDLILRNLTTGCREKSCGSLSIHIIILRSSSFFEGNMLKIQTLENEFLIIVLLQFKYTISVAVKENK